MLSVTRLTLPDGFDRTRFALQSSYFFCNHSLFFHVSFLKRGAGARAASNRIRVPIINMKANLLKLLCGAAIGAAGMTTFAGPLNRADVPAQAIWVVHVDCDILRPTAIGQYLLSELDKPDVQAKFAAFQSIFSFDPRKQLHGLTLYSAGSAAEDGVLLMYADFDPERLVTLAKAANGYQSVTNNQHVIHNWIDDKKKSKNGVKPRTYAAFQDSRVVVFGQRQSALASALDVLARSAPSLSTSKSFPEMGTPADTSFLQAAANKLNLSGSDPNAALFRLSKMFRLQIGETQGKLTATLSVEANDEEVAGQMASVGQGLLSLIKLQKDKPEATKLAEALSLKQDGANVAATLALPADDLINLARADAAKKAPKKAEQE